MKKVLKTLKSWLYTLHLGAFISSILEDIFIFSGLGVITWATFLVSKIAGLYVLGVFLFGIGAYLARYSVRRG